MTGIMDRDVARGDFGLSFDYSVWGPGTEVTLCCVPWDSEYRDVFGSSGPEETIRFIREYNKGIGVRTVDVHNLTYLAQGQPVRLDIPFSEGNVYNYMIVQNSAFPIKSENRATTFFYFIQDVSYVAPQTTQFNLMLDVWQTYHHLVDFGSAFVEQSHCLEAVDTVRSTEKRRLLTQPENYEVGTRYAITRAVSTPIVVRSEDASEAKRREYTAIIIASVDLNTSFGDVNNPQIYAAKGANVKYDMAIYDGETGLRLLNDNEKPIVSNGCGVYACPAKNLPDVMAAISSAPWVAQGIQAIYFIPSSVVYSGFDLSGALAGKGIQAVTSVSAGSDTKVLANWHNAAYINNLPDSYTPTQKAYLRRFDKFYTAPYMYIEVGLNNSSPLLLQPEMLKTGPEGDDVVMHGEWHILPPSPRAVFYPQDYNRGDFDVPAKRGSKWYTEYLGDSLMITDFPSTSVVSSGGTMALASSAHSRVQSFANARWSRDKSYRSIQTGYDATMRGIDASNEQLKNSIGTNNLNTALANTTAELQNSLANMNGAVQGGIGAISGGISGGVSGAGAGVLGAIGGAVTGAAGSIANAGMGYVNNNIQNNIGQNQRNLANTIGNNAMRTSNAISTGLTQANADANRKLARWATEGDYRNAIQNIQAAANDAQTTGPLMAGAVGGDGWNIYINGFIMYARVRAIEPSAVQRIGDFWARYGYAVNRYINLPHDLRCMQIFTYWKCVDVYVSSTRVPNVFTSIIKGLLEKGVTVWHIPSRIGGDMRSAMLDNAHIKWNGSESL